MFGCLPLFGLFAGEMAKLTRKKTEIWLIGGTEDHFSCAKLPSRGEVLKVLFDFHIQKEHSLNDSVKETVTMILQIWERARIPTRAKNHLWDQLRRLHKEWQGLKKNITRKSATEEGKRDAFRDSLDNVFDIAHEQAMTMIKIEEDRQFLKAQREKGRHGSIAGIDVKLAKQEERALARSAAVAVREEQHHASSAAVTDVVVLDSSSEETALSADSSEEEPKKPSTSSGSRRRKRGKISVVTREVAAALDRTKTSSRNATYIFSAMATSDQFTAPVSELMISPSSVQRARKVQRAALAAEIRESFHPLVPLTLHWDGKIMPNYTGTEQLSVDRLPIMVSGKEVTKLLAIPKLYSGTAAIMAEACMAEIRSWELENRIVALCFDTTASNTGIKGGVCIKLETELGKDLLNLACRHHVSEIVLEKVFSLYDVSRSSKIEIFSHFRDFWPNIDQSKYRTALDDVDASEHVDDIRESIITFAMQQLNTKHPRDDYEELLQLTVIFLGATPPKGIRFRYPGAVHRARWMARAIYAIKMWLFRDQFHIQQRQSTTRASVQSHSRMVWKHLLRVSLFVTTTYVKYWFTCPSAGEAPRNDLQFLKALHSYPDKEVSNAALTAFSRHLWYLSETLIGLSLFCDSVTVDEKRCMVHNMHNNQGSDEPPKRLPPIKDPSTMALPDFVTTSTIKLLQILGLDETFLEEDPQQWEANKSYNEATNIISALRVTNDLAERGVALMQSFNEALVRNEEEKQFVLQMVEYHRNKFPKSVKATEGE